MPELSLGFISNKFLLRWAVVCSCLALVSVASALTADPHRSKSDERSCNICHDSPDFSRPDKLCISCHQCGKFEDSDCLDCHEIHGRADVVLFMRKGRVEKEVTRRSQSPHNRKGDCLACHRNEPKEEEDPWLNYEGDINLICGDCHGHKTCQHPVGVGVPDYMKTEHGLLLDDEKRITCITCHLPECRKDGTISLAGFSRTRTLQTNELCYRCHKPVAGNPHQNIARRRNCRDCHSKVPQRSGQIPGRTLFAGSRLVCLLCHPERPHPANVDHRREFAHVEIQRKRNFRIDSLGRITCISCHDPHSDPRLSCKTNAAYCIDCHGKYF